MMKLREWKPSLQPIAENTVFSSCTLNLGPCVESYVHTDLKNLAWGLCAITAFGNFNPDKEGYLVLWDYKLVIRFPAGSTILITSAVTRHSNSCVSEGHERMSFTQYSAGALFRWVDYGFKSVGKYERQVGEEVFRQKNEERWRKGVDMLPKVAR
jgi:hypothetical protein